MTQPGRSILREMGRAQCPSHATKRSAGPWPPLSSIAPFSLWLGLYFLLLSLQPGWAQSDTPGRRVPERVYLNYLQTPSTRIPLGATGQDFFFRLPAHVRFSQGSTLHIVLRNKGIPAKDLCRMEVAVNRRTLFQGLPGPDLATEGETNVVRLSLPMPEGILEADWNRITLRFAWRAPVTWESGSSSSHAYWEIRDTDSFISFVYERLPLFPELRRFPQSMLEESLLRSPFLPGEKDPIGVTLLLPDRKTDAHLRAVAVLGACLGKPGYESSLEVKPLGRWDEEKLVRNGVVAGTAGDLLRMALPPGVEAPLLALAKGQGLITEVIVGSFPQERRWVFVAGSEDVGLQKALLTLVNQPALIRLPPIPVVVDEFPTDPAPLLSHQADQKIQVPLRVDLPGNWWFRGLYETERDLVGWVLPPTFQTGTNGFIDLAFEHATNLTADSHLELEVQGRILGRVALGPETAQGGQARVPLPDGLVGSGAMPIRVRAHLNAMQAPCDLPPDQEVWLRLRDDATLTYHPSPIQARDLQQAQAFLVSDPYLRQTTFLLPKDASWEELTWLMDLSQRLGTRLAEAPLLWPQVLSYSPEKWPDVEQLQGRSVLLLGSLKEWSHPALAGTDLLVRPGPYPGQVLVQGRHHQVDQFEPTLAVLSFVRSPWDDEQRMMVAGGWDRFDLQGLTRMLMDPESHALVYGLCGAMDQLGRAASYDPRQRQSESLAQRWLRRLPPGLTVDETLVWRYREQLQSRRFEQRNFLIAVWTGLVLILLVTGRIWLLWERGRLERQAQHQAEPNSP